MSPLIRNVLGIIASYLFVFGVIGVATLLMKSGRMGPSTTRKVIHIGVAHWWIIAMLTMDDPWVASIGPASFIIINAAAMHFRLLPAMDEGAAQSNRGTVYFPLTLLVLVNLRWRGVIPLWLGGVASLVLGWGDGLASVLGESIRGVRRATLAPALGASAAVAAAATAVELVIPLGLDNLTVPLAVTALYAGVFL